MSKAVMISIQPKWCELIASGKKTIEVRKTRPQIETPFKCYIYQTKKKWIYRLLEKLGLYQSKVIGEFVCDAIYKIEPHNDGYGVNQYICDWQYGEAEHCLTFEELRNYLGENKGYGWHISDLKIYDKPRELGEFSTMGLCFNIHNVECTTDIWGDYHFHYSQNSLCRACKCLNDLGDCRKSYHSLTRPPQSWCYVEEN